MKKLITVILIVTLLFTSVCFAQPVFTKSSGILSSTGAIYAKPGILTGCLALTDGTHNAILTLYDGTSASGNMLVQIPVTAAALFGGATFEIPVSFGTALYATVSGTGATFIVYYNVGP